MYFLLIVYKILILHPSSVGDQSYGNRRESPGRIGEVDYDQRWDQGGGAGGKDMVRGMEGD